jgi:hemerythrin-like domain-containing protein
MDMIADLGRRGNLPYHSISKAGADRFRRIEHSCGLFIQSASRNDLKNLKMIGSEIMKATKQLMDEHEGIKLMLDIIGKICRKIESKQEVDSKTLDQIIEFLRTFVDKCHHAKEEELLFPALEKVGIAKEGGPIGVMLQEHEAGRKLVKSMAGEIDRYKKDKQATAKFLEYGRGYIKLLTDHIEKENNVLFRMADMRLSEKEQDKLYEEFEKIEVVRIGAGKHEGFHKLLHHLKEIYLA